MTLQLSFFFATLCSLDVYFELVAKVVRELKLFIFDVAAYLGTLLGLSLPRVFLQIAEEEEALTELNVLGQRLSQTVANLLKV